MSDARSAPATTELPQEAEPRSRTRPWGLPRGFYDAPTHSLALARDTLFRRSLAVADILAATLALVLAVELIGDGDHLRLGSLAMLPLVLITGKAYGLYAREEIVLRRTTLDEAPKLFGLATFYSLLATLLQGAFMSGELGRLQLFVLWASLFCFTLAGRMLARALVRRVTTAERCFVLGDEQTAAQIAEKFAESRNVRAVVVGRGPLTGDGAGEVDFAALGSAIREYDPQRVILAPQVTDSEAMLDVVALVKGAGVKVTILPRLFEVVGSSVEFDEVGGLTMLTVRRFGLGRSERVLKRLTDLAGAALALVATAPLMAVIAVAVRLESRGPVLFHQVRVGRDGRRFAIVKFRTMVADAESRKAELLPRNETEGLFKIADDPRVTPVGRWLRRTALDELPQLFNVLRGEMSLVGPRPLVVEEDAKVEGFHRRRLHLTPGMTGPWQIMGSGRIPLGEMVKIDYLYVANWSLWRDVKIMLRTVPYMLRRGGL